MIFAAVPNIHIHKSLDGNYSLRKKEIWRHSHPLDFFKHVLNQNVQRGLNAFILEWRWSFPAGNRIHCLDLLCSKNVNQGMSSEENSLWKVKEKVSCLKDNRTPKLAFKQQSGQKREKQKHFRGVNSDTGSLTVNRHFLCWSSDSLINQSQPSVMSAGPKVGDITSRRWKQRQQTVYWGRWWRWKKPGTVDVLLSLISCRSSPADKIHKNSWSPWQHAAKPCHELL